MELWFTEKHTANVNFSIKVDRQLYSGKSEFQRIDIFDSREFGRFLTLDGYMMLTEKDEFIYHGKEQYLQWYAAAGHCRSGCTASLAAGPSVRLRGFQAAPVKSKALVKTMTSAFLYAF